MNETSKKEMDLESIIDDLDKACSLNGFITNVSSVRRRGKTRKNWTPLIKAFLTLAGKENVALKLHRSEYRATSANGHLNKLLREVQIDGKRLTEEEIKEYKSHYQFGKRPDYRGEALSIINGDLNLKEVDEDGLTYILIKKPLPEKLRIALYKMGVQD